MEGTVRRVRWARVVAACACAGAMVAWAPASTEGSPGPAGGEVVATSATWRQVAEVRPPAEAAWSLGSAVAVRGDVMAVGPARDWDLGQDQGGVRLYAREGLAWREAGELRHPAADMHAQFGGAVAIDGAFMAISAPRDGTRGFQSGCVFVYQRKGARWSLHSTLMRPHAAAGDLAGTSVAISGRTLVIGVPKADEGGLDTGAAEVLELRDDAWVHAATLTAPSARVGSFFGIAVAIDGGTVFVGAPGDDSDGPIAGRVHVYRRTGRGWAWDGSVGCPTGPRGWFGAAVAAADGLAVVGAPRAARPGAADSLVRGAAWSLQRRNGAWVCQQLFVPARPEEGDSIGCSIATDGRTVLIGATADSVRGDLAGSAFAFTRQAGGAWRQQRLDPLAIGASSLVGHGLAVDGRWIALGRLGDPEADPAPGEVTMFHASAGSIADRPAASADRPRDAP